MLTGWVGSRRLPLARTVGLKIHQLLILNHTFVSMHFLAHRHVPSCKPKLNKYHISRTDDHTCIRCGSDRIQTWRRVLMGPGAVVAYLVDINDGIIRGKGATVVWRGCAGREGGGCDASMACNVLTCCSLPVAPLYVPSYRPRSWGSLVAVIPGWPPRVAQG